MKTVKSETWVALMQCLVVLMASTGLLRLADPGWEIWAAQGVLVTVYVWILMFKIRMLYADDFESFMVFFAGLGLIVQTPLLLASQGNLETSFGWNTQIFLYTAIALVLFLGLFRFKYGRKYALGTVLVSNSEWTAVEIKFDLHSFVPAGKYVVQSRQKFAEQVKVKIGLARSWNKPMPSEIIGTA